VNLWPPFLFTGIRVIEITEDWSRVTVRLGLHRWNRNYVGTHFGGSLFAMTDPWWMLLALHRLGRRYLVWDKAGAIDFVAPGKADVYAQFVLEESVVEELRAAAADGSKVLRWFEVDVKTTDGTVVARVRKQLYVRLKPNERPGAAAIQTAGQASDKSTRGSMTSTRSRTVHRGSSGDCSRMAAMRQTFSRTRIR
jgi:acyl-coenzyme A thioesterase PaaI-like protein